MIAPAAVVAEARLWIGTPYRLYQARRGIAVDCMGLPMAVGQALGLLPASLRNTPDQDAEAMLAAILARHMRVLAPGQDGVPVHPIGAVVQVAMTPGGFARHLAITAWQDGRPSLIHALEGNRGVRETPVGRWCEGTSWPRVVAWYGFKGTITLGSSIMATLILGAGLSALGGSLFTAGTTAALLAASAFGTAGALIGGVIDRGLFGPGDSFIRQPTLEGPRVDRLTIMQSTYGAPLPAVKGWERIAGNVIFSQGLEEERIEHSETQTQQSGGKGGGGASTTTSQTTIEYVYSATFAVGICQGPIAGVGRIWGDTKIVYDVLSDQGAVDWTARQPITVYTGALDQDRDPVMASWLGTTNTPAYRGVAYAVFNRYPLARFGNRIPNLTFEVLV